MVTDAVSLTLDVDWAPDEALAEVVAQIERAGVPATFFATHRSPFLQQLDSELIDVGLHPDFTRGDGDFDGKLAELKSYYPGATGGRSHGLYQSSWILQLYARHGLRYESNVYLHEHPHLRAVPRFRDLVSIPFCFSDDKVLELGRPFDATSVPLAMPGVKVLNFHPIHIYMNTRDPEHYEAYKAHTPDAAALAPHRHDGEGVGTMFTRTLEAIATGDQRAVSMRELCDAVAAVA